MNRDVRNNNIIRYFQNGGDNDYGPKKIRNKDKVYKRGKNRKGRTKEEWVRSGSRRNNIIQKGALATLAGLTVNALKKSVWDKR
jgi:hypothetical protein